MFDSDQAQINSEGTHLPKVRYVAHWRAFAHLPPSTPTLLASCEIYRYSSKLNRLPLPRLPVYSHC
jgi:hypothetical protein